MNDIERTLIDVINAITKEVQECDRNEIKNAWNTYRKAFPSDIGMAMGHLQDTLLIEIMKKHSKMEKTAIILGQYMKNLSWALQKNDSSNKDNFLKSS